MSNRRYKYYVLHCTATPEGTEVTKGMIEQWHRGPKRLSDGRVVYNGITYESASQLPKENINNIPIQRLSGNGWSSLGYTILYNLAGERKVITRNNYDAFAERWEITNGVAGINSQAWHVVYAGGCDLNMKPKDTRTEIQKELMAEDCFEIVRLMPDILIAGHNQFASKACPSFNTTLWLKEIGIPEENIFKGR